MKCYVFDDKKEAECIFNKKKKKNLAKPNKQVCKILINYKSKLKFGN